METKKAKPLRVVVGWICMGLAILIMLTSIVLSGGQSAVGPVLLPIGIALLVVGTVLSLGAAMKAAGDKDRDTR